MLDNIEIKDKSAKIKVTNQNAGFLAFALSFCLFIFAFCILGLA